ncbi:hypothetical protein LTR66_001850 [Elasticomyces elasticus]|nr:hypothetical protein LTR66_001850 [Elasticomyces elasticus]KAK5011161.1 hypothetical protein LTR28_005234 [Elasticomyces elasticus]
MDRAQRVGHPAELHPKEEQDRALASCCRLQAVLSRSLTRSKISQSLPTTSKQHTRRLSPERPGDLVHLSQPEAQRGTVLYLAYGSNLSVETFRGKRGIKPLSQINVQVPSLRLTFDLPGIPYAEPCFANSGRRDPLNDPPSSSTPLELSTTNEKTPLLLQPVPKTSEYNKDAWHKGLIGVVYEVTPSDYAHIIATEGGGSSYTDILVPCHPFSSSDPSAPVPQDPSTPSFHAHTLFAPARDPNAPPPKDGGRFQRPDTSYAQASARYLKLITDGAAECGLPHEYQDYLHRIRPYTVTTNKQRLGQYIFLGIWVPIVMFVFMLQRMFQDEHGRSPEWLRLFLGGIFRAVWASYDGWFRDTFGDGERTVEEDGDDRGASGIDGGRHAEYENNEIRTWAEKASVVEMTA